MAQKEKGPRPVEGAFCGAVVARLPGEFDANRSQVYKDTPIIRRNEAVRALRARWLLIAGICLVVAGYGLLLATDRMGRNAASHLAPVLILGGIVFAALDAFRKE